jgi:sigma-B regulation protein RsbU (phosphoserine phosphatase)
MSILIMDDTASQRFLLSSILKAAGYANLITAASAMDAFERLGMNDPSTLSTDVDLILMDISMPEIDGLEACRRIKADLAAQDIPIIMVTASTEEEDLQLAFDAGAMYIWSMRIMAVP